jgi:hypothetical protein
MQEKQRREELFDRLVHKLAKREASLNEKLRQGESTVASAAKSKATMVPGPSLNATTSFASQTQLPAKLNLVHNYYIGLLQQSKLNNSS